MINTTRIWRPFTQEKTALPSIKIVRGEGAYVFDEAGKKYLDLISSWWVNLHGHANKEIADAVYEQAKTLEHMIFAGFTHDAAENLCKKLSSILPEQLCKFFFSDNGSTSVEIALKMAYQYWKNKGFHNKKKFVSFYGGYHGDTVGAMSVGSGYHETFRDLCFDSFKISWPSTWIGDELVDEKEKKAIDEYQKYLSEYGEHTAVIIVEPMIQGAGGMRMVRPEFLRQIVDISRKNEVIIIFDEVMTGFYRTGKMLALEHLNNGDQKYCPDILCISKGITGGFLPLSLTITTEKIYDAFLDDSFNKAFVHGHSYTANPLGCAAALVSFDILQRSKTLRNINEINQIHMCWAKKLIAHKSVNKVRILGTICAFSIENSSSYKMANIVSDMQACGFIVRPLKEVLYFIPPYCTSGDQLNDAYKRLLEII